MTKALDPVPSRNATGGETSFQTILFYVHILFVTDSPTLTDAETLAALHLQGAVHFHGFLVAMVEGGAGLAQRIVEQAVPPAPAAASAKPFAEVTRSVRQSIILAQKITAPPRAAKADPDERRVAARKQIIRRVEDSLYIEAPERAEALHEEFLERLETLEFDEEIAQLRPVSEIINEIRADLGVCGADSENWWPRRTPADIAVLRARAEAGPVAPLRPKPECTEAGAPRFRGGP